MMAPQLEAQPAEPAEPAALVRWAAEPPPREMRAEVALPRAAEVALLRAAEVALPQPRSSS